MYLELHQIIKPSSTTSHMHISVFIGRIGQRAGSDAHAPQRPRCLSLRNPFLCDEDRDHPYIGGVIAPGSDRIRRAAGARSRRLVNCGWSLSRYVAHSFIHRNTH